MDGAEFNNFGNEAPVKRRYFVIFIVFFVLAVFLVLFIVITPNKIKCLFNDYYCFEKNINEFDINQNNSLIDYSKVNCSIVSCEDNQDWVKCNGTSVERQACLEYIEENILKLDLEFLKKEEDKFCQMMIENNFSCESIEESRLKNMCLVYPFFLKLFSQKNESSCKDPVINQLNLEVEKYIKDSDINELDLDTHASSFTEEVCMNVLNAIKNGNKNKCESSLCVEIFNFYVGIEQDNCQLIESENSKYNCEYLDNILKSNSCQYTFSYDIYYELMGVVNNDKSYCNKIIHPIGVEGCLEDKWDENYRFPIFF